MPQRCTVCSHAKTKEIEELIIQGKPNTTIADKYDLDHQAIRRHGKNHLPEKLVKATKEKGKEHAKDMLDTIQDLLDTSQTILDEAIADDQKTTALQAIRESRNTVQLMAQIAAKLQELRQEAKDKKEGYANHYAQKGLKTLTDKELEVFTQLLGKIHAADDDYVMDREIQEFINGAKRIWPEIKTNDDIDASHQQGSSRSKMTRTRTKQPKNTKREKKEEEVMLDDLDDLDLSGSSEISSGETDPKWLRRERRSRRRK